MPSNNPTHLNQKALLAGIFDFAQCMINFKEAMYESNIKI
jgi:hypothetical protein